MDYKNYDLQCAAELRTRHRALVVLLLRECFVLNSIVCTALRSRVNSLTNCSFDAVPVSLRGRHVCASIPNCASPCDVSEFFDTEIPKAYCRRCSTFFLMSLEHKDLLH